MKGAGSNRPPSGSAMPLTFDELTKYDNRRLDPLMVSGPVPTLSDVVGYEFRG